MSFRDDIQSNRRLAAMIRDDELEAVRVARPPTDLRVVPREHWDEYLQRDLALPPDVAAYLKGEKGRPLTSEECDGMAAQVAAFHGIAAPWYVVVSPDLQSTGKAWEFVPEASAFLTGFYLDRAP